MNWRNVAPIRPAYPLCRFIRRRPRQNRTIAGGLNEHRALTSGVAPAR